LAAGLLHLASDSTAAPPSLRWRAWGRPQHERCTNHYRQPREHAPARPLLPSWRPGLRRTAVATCCPPLRNSAR